MNEATAFLFDYGAAILFAVVFIEQIGLPLPAAPWLLAAGALAANGKLNLAAAVSVSVLACLLGDVIWFYLGRRHGVRMLKLFSRFSLEPETCIRKTRTTYLRHGRRGIVAAKFVPGLAAVMPPLAGMLGSSVAQFLFYDAIGALLYGGFFILTGFLFDDQLIPIGKMLAQQTRGALGAIAVVSLTYIGFKYLRRRRTLRRLRMPRMTVEELRRRQEAGDEVVVIDLRSGDELALDPAMIPGARHVPFDQLEERHGELPRDRDIVPYCACPNEITSAQAALKLRRKGIDRVQPLLGGIDAWRKLDYPTRPWEPGPDIS